MCPGSHGAARRTQFGNHDRLLHRWSAALPHHFKVEGDSLSVCSPYLANIFGRDLRISRVRASLSGLLI